VATGTAAGAACFPTQAEAAARHCASVVGVTSGGVVSCDGADGAAVLSASDGGTVEFPWVMRTQPSGGAASLSTVTTTLHACERYDVLYFAPWVGAWVLALAVIVGLKLAAQRMFARESL